MPSENVFRTGTEFPALENGQLRLYSMRFCPYAERTRLVLAHKKIPYETINIDLKAKPEWFLERSPFGTVPVLERDDKLIPESLVTCDYLDDVYSDNRLNPTDPYTRARDRIIVELYSKTITEYYKILFSKEDCSANADAYRQKMEPVEKALQERGNFFGGEKVGMVDYMVWPWLERLSVMSDMAGSDLLPVERFPNMRAWVNRMIKLPTVEEASLASELHEGTYKSWRAGNPNFDYGLE